jgi:nucleoside-diphosphate-sugar epimerase
MLLVITHDACAGKVFNLGSTRAHSLIEFVETLNRFCTFKVEQVPFPEEKRIIDIGDYIGDFSRFRNATGWRPRIDLEEGLRRTVAFYHAHKDVYWDDREAEGNRESRRRRETIPATR